MKSPKIIPLSDRGQITLPQKIRQQVKFKFFTCDVENGTIVLKPLQTREEFFQELEDAEKDWEKNGGKTLKQIAKEYHLKL